MTVKKLFLAGDIGGTKTKLALLSKHEGTLHIEAKDTFPSKLYPGLEPVLEKFLSGHEVDIASACFGIAGPVVEGQVATPNLPWVVNAEKIAEALGLKSVALLNDLEAAAYGIFTLGPDELFSLNDGKERCPGNKVLIAAGTGLGEATLYDDGGGEYHPSASEGGHGDFAPTDEIQIELLRALMRKFGHVSYERVVSGPGLQDIYAFLKDSGRALENETLREQLAAADPSAVITEAALAGASELCAQALHLFVSVYGAEAGNLALRGKATGGVYIGGGIAPKILDKLKDGTFMRAFLDKGRYKELLSGIPVQVILNEEAPLQGAAYYVAFRFHS
jgi:glucokinase